MQEKELAEKIREYIRTWYKAEFTGLLEVHKLNPGYRCVLGIPSYMSHTYLSIDTEDENEFLEYVYLELRKRNYIRKDTYVVKRIDEFMEE